MVLVCIRHALSVFNVMGRSRPNCSLAAAGIAQAKRVVGEFNHVVCSPMLRAKQTLELSSIRYDTLEFDEDAREKRDDACDFFPHEPTVRETYIEFSVRMKRLNDKLTSLEEWNPSVLLVAHAYVVLAISRIREGKPLPMDEEDAIALALEYHGNCVPNARLIPMPDAPSYYLHTKYPAEPTEIAESRKAE